MQMAEQDILIVDKSLVHCCAIRKNVIVASLLYDVADVQFTVLYIGVWVARLTLLGPNFSNLVPNNTCWLQNFGLALFWPFSRIDFAPCKYWICPHRVLSKKTHFFTFLTN